MSTSNLEIARRFVQAVGEGAASEALRELCDPAVTQHEYPNRLFPQGAHRDGRALLESAERGKQVLSSQRYEIRNAVASGDQVALELDWTGTLAVPLGTLKPGAQLHATIGQFLTFREGRIVSIRNYDCYDPF
jgi:ketosteroid isomerase-like protein